MKTTAWVDVTAFYLKFCVDESCGKCAPCRVRAATRCSSSCSDCPGGRGTPEDIAQIHTASAQPCKRPRFAASAKPHPTPLSLALRYFEHEFRAYIEGGTAYARNARRPSPRAKNLREAS